MDTRVDEIADGIYRLSSYVRDIAPPAGFTFNQFLVLGDEPLLFHTGLRGMFGHTRTALARIVDPAKLLRELVGTDPQFRTEEVQEFLRFVGDSGRGVVI